MAGIYLHIPFCKKACHYCDFHFSTNTKISTELVHALKGELLLQKHYLNHEKVETIYFGGGTPSLLPTADLDTVLSTIRQHFVLDSSAEVTLEANPDDLNEEKLAELKAIGINRLSIGIQSFDDGILKFLNRAHDSTMATKSVEEARALGFNNISIDLIYAIPGQDLNLWNKNIAKAIELDTEHISAYALTIEERTVFGAWAAQKKISIPDNDAAATDMLLLIDALEIAGYQHYEVSNFSKPGYMSQHNSSYWRDDKYLGVGPSAHSYNGTTRQYNISNNYQYVKAIQSGRVPATAETLNPADKINDWILTTLRTSWGTDLKKLRNQHQYDLLKIHGGYINSLVDGNLAIVDNDALILTRKGRLLADKIASDLFASFPS